MSRHPNLFHLFDLLPGEKTSLASQLASLKSVALVASKFEKFEKNATASATATLYDTISPSAHVSKKSKITQSVIVEDTYPISILKHILQVADAVESALAQYHKNQTNESESKSSPSASSSSSSSSSTNIAASSSSSSSSSSPIVDYVSTLSPLRFGEVDNFTSHHYIRQYGSSKTVLSRNWVKRLASEFADLSKSLPIHPLSSAWLRYKEDDIAHCQFLIGAPNETPYAFGLFLFDAHFPVAYPNQPPLVNLQTTGGGSVRFNPNLYNWSVSLQ